MLTILILLGLIAAGYFIVVIAEKLDAYMNRNSTINKES
jgi:hypothetical protein